MRILAQFIASITGCLIVTAVLVRANSPSPLGAPANVIGIVGGVLVIALVFRRPELSPAKARDRHLASSRIGKIGAGSMIVGIWTLLLVLAFDPYLPPKTAVVLERVGHSCMAAAFVLCGVAILRAFRA